MATQTEFDNAALEELTLTVRVIASNYVTKEELAVLNGKIDVLAKEFTEKYDVSLKAQVAHLEDVLKAMRTRMRRHLGL